MSPGAPFAYRRLALWGALATKFVAAWGLAWDIQWHMTIDLAMRGGWDEIMKFLIARELLPEVKGYSEG